MATLQFFSKLLDILDYLAALILSQRRESQSDNLAVILRVDAEIGGLDSLLDGVKGRSVPGWMQRILASTTEIAAS